ncbi:HupE/UreJ family protein [Jiangella asiatica]|uniref:HupE/UreJ family protein n=1 Tax=Jiangella asiatica TaxID=2530372 RepID=A0A4R5DHY9_9ACTN|nr:HupE/UreJ family protein [Jiangella asiatica]TDE11504.1 hypothetical protein E1269_09605 [Jiangella asiatica]
MTTRTSRTHRMWAGLAVVPFLLLLAAGSAASHVRTSDGYSEIRSHGDGVDYRLSLEHEILARGIGMGTHAIEAPDDPARRAALTEHHELVERYLAGRVEIVADSVACDLTLERTDVEQRPASDATAADIPYAVLELRFDCHGAGSGEYVVHYSVFSGRPVDGANGGADDALGSDAVVDDHTTTVDYDLGGERGRVVLDGGHDSFSVGEQSVGPAALRALLIGFERSAGVPDHALFVVALVLGASTVSGLVRLVAVFALAQGAALTFAAATATTAPAEVVGPLVALSVVYAAGTALGASSRGATALGGAAGGSARGVRSLGDAPTRYRLLVVAAAGLLHGLDLAGELRFGGPLGRDLVTSFGGVVAGLQVGHLLVAAALFPLVAIARRYAWSALTQLAAAATVAVTGLAWFVDRLF